MEHDPVYLQAVDKFDAALAVQTEVDFVRFEAETGSYEAAYKLFESTNQDRPQNYPVGASLEYNVLGAVCQEDYKEAKERIRAKTMVTPLNVIELHIDGQSASSEHVKHVQNYIDSDGGLRGKAMTQFITARIGQEVRVLKGASVVCALANNCGSDLLALAINRSIMVMDETGQMTSSAMAVPLTTYTR